MLVKLTCRGRDFPTAVRRARRALAEFRIRGVTTNIPFLQAVLDDPAFAAGGVSTSFIEQRPALLQARPPADRGTRLLNYLADVTVNKPNGERPSLADPADKLPDVDLSAEVPPGSRQRLLALGPEGFAASMRAAGTVGLTDTTFRDAHQSLLATRVRTKDLVTVAPYLARQCPELLSVECWGGATYDVALRFLAEDPWERLAALREALPNVCLQMLLRGRNTVGYTPYPTEVTDAFVAEAARTGLDIFRIFDAFNNVEQMRPAIEAVRATDTAVAEVALCYTADLSDPNETLYTLDYYLELAQQLVGAGAHVLAIKDMAGLLRPPAAATLVRALRAEFDVPVHVHTHDTAGGQVATYLAAIEAGADAIDGASAAMSGTTSQPSLSAIVAATDHSARPTGLSLPAVTEFEPYWEIVRRVYRPFEAGLPSSTGRVYHHEIPGGQLSNLRAQATALGLGDRFEEIEATYEAADEMLGRLIKVTPSSKVVGDLALHLVGAGVDPAEFEADPARFDIPDSVIGFLRGELGEPVGGWPEPFREKALQGRAEAKGVTPLTQKQHKALAEKPRETLNELLFPGPTRDFLAHRASYGDTSVLPSKDFFYGLVPGYEYGVDLEPGVRLLIELEAIGEPDERGYRTVLATLNGQLRPIQVRDRSATVQTPAAEKADRANPGHVAAPFGGVVTLSVSEGAKVSSGASVATIEAMKMEAAITAPKNGKVKRRAITGVQQVEGGDLLIELE
jgi:pyruvate carboxylase